ncbi:MAG: bifunctional phosphoribosyl-AMP cyclohydrolase/phosphoribosyl-ATP diphosphatase HisIE [Acholeplasmataceae bacterium]|nr:bifunctional phosphoribosyl-AMP cyclohydrolase/phosphoribosyl-ATP diphosphatase HisIE [Acidaminococcaceae bacterium]NLY84217.1 bifunctional phosphoribosyl-AMP cyclohydrolase/phosphoribosyl-ATP diphosphatase HisIE [Acholeplasmataceae bacterium]
MKIDFANLKFAGNGLLPAIVQDAKTAAVLMLAYMNEEALARTVESGFTWFWSRSRQELWNKGATSGNFQKVLSITYDCDGDALLLKVEQTGNACHTGSFSCFSYPLWNSAEGRNLPVPNEASLPGVLAELYSVIQQKKENGGEKSYTRYLFMSGQDKILKKVGEEAAETIIASKNDDGREVVTEMSDLWYHCLVLLAYHNIAPGELLSELGARRKQENNSKY